MTEPCRYEGTIAVLKDDIPEIKQDIKKLLKVISGNGDAGLVTKVALNQAAISRIWWIVGPMCGAVLVGGIKMIFFGN